MAASRPGASGSSLSMAMSAEVSMTISGKSDRSYPRISSAVRWSSLGSAAHRLRISCNCGRKETRACRAPLPVQALAKGVANGVWNAFTGVRGDLVRQSLDFFAIDW